MAFPSLASLTFPLESMLDSQGHFCWGHVLWGLHGVVPDAGKCEGEDAVLVLKGSVPVSSSKCILSVAAIEGVASGGW